MPIPDSEIIHALVVLAPAGKPSGPPTAANLAEWQPPAGAADAATAFLRQLGFTVEPSGETALRISGRAGLFQNVFQTVLKKTKRGGVVCHDDSPDLPLAALPAPLRAVVEAVGFEQPPEFGPGSFA
jgi:hypothetical protein